MIKFSTLAVLLCCAGLGWAQPADASGDPLKGSITGRVVDQRGRPMAGVRVTAWRWNYRQGRRELDQVMLDGPVTGGDGSYRIGNVDPGNYVLRTEDPYLAMRDLAVARNLPSRPSMVTTYYPGVIDVSSAGSVEVDAGRVSGGIEIRAQNPPTYHVRGRVSGPGAMLNSIRRQGGLVPSDSRIVSTAAGGSFDIGGVLPGTYLIEGDNMQYSASAEVTVKDADIDDLVIQTTPCPKVRGTVTVDGVPAEPAPASPTGFMLTRPGMGIPGQVTANGAFAVSCAAPESYSLSVPLETGQYVKSVTLDGKDVTDSLDDLDLTSSADKTLNIALASRAADLRGTVRDADGKPLAGVPVSLWKFNGGYDGTAESAPDGTFAFKNLAPGSYRAAAWNGLRPQPAGWGVQTVSEFRDAFETEATHLTLGEGEHATVDPAVISREAIERTAERLKLNAIVADAAEEAAISAAAKSPETLAEYFRSHSTIDWKVVRKALGGKDDQDWLAPCGAAFPFGSSQCTAEMQAVAPGEQTILTIRGGMASHAEEHLRYLRLPGGGWKFAGEVNAAGHYETPSHRMTQVNGKPFFVVSTDRSQNGFSVAQTLEEWYDLTVPDFEPVFSFTTDGGNHPFCFAPWRNFESTFTASVAPGVERIEAKVDMRFYGGGDMSAPQSYTGVYERRDGEKSFTLRQATIPVKDFEGLTDPFDVPDNIVAYAFPGLQGVAEGSDADAKECLRMMLDRAKDTPEKRRLLDLLGKP